MKLLPAPYGWDPIGGRGGRISLRTNGPFDKERLVEVLAHYSCHKPAIPKIISCLAASQRYDCIVQAGWYKEQRYELTNDLHQAGVQLIHIGWNDDV